MNNIAHISWVRRYPLLLPIIFVIGSIFLFKLVDLYPYRSEFTENMAHSSAQILLCICLIWLLIRFDIFAQTGLTRPVGQWPRKWPFAVIPMAMIGLINLISTDWSDLSFDGIRLGGWIFNSVSTGLFEEILLRGFCFYFLLQCWQGRKNALLWAALAQALIFGLAHLSNLQDNLAGDVIPQVIYATLLGIGFAGIAAYTQSVWPTIAIHSFINAMGDLDTFFAPEQVETVGSATNYLGAIMVIFLVSTLPGLYLLHLRQRHLTEG
tara:strand:- start:26755 stop:27552 length:798 start_codon:yes stop_codon:yes gene_type:complete